MSFKAISSSLITRLSREHWGYKILDKDGNPRDPGLQEFVDEFLNALVDEGPIRLTDTIKVVAPPNAPIIQIINDGGDGGDGGGATANVQVLTNVTVQSVDVSGLTVDTSGMAVDTSGMDVSIAVDGCDVTATLTGSAELTGGAVISGTVVVTLSLTFTTLSFANGLFQGAS